MTIANGGPDDVENVQVELIVLEEESTLEEGDILSQPGECTNGIERTISHTGGGVFNEPFGWDATSIGAFPRSPDIGGFTTHHVTSRRSSSTRGR